MPRSPHGASALPPNVTVESDSLFATPRAEGASLLGWTVMVDALDGAVVHVRKNWIDG